MENQNKKTTQERRKFLKKATYVIPSVIALGQITNPVTTAAGSSISLDDDGNNLDDILGNSSKSSSLNDKPFD